MRATLLCLALAATASAQEPLYVSPDPQSTQPRWAQAFDGLVYFLAESPPASGDVQGTWRTDGTVDGTEFVSPVNWLGRSAVVDGTLYFVGLDAPNNGGTGPQNLYRLDGGPRLRPCEMSAAWVAEVVLDLRVTERERASSPPAGAASP